MALLDKVASSFLSKESVITNAINTTYADLTEPTYLVFEPIFNFNMATGLLADENNKNSALAYLKRNGETERYVRLQRAIEILKIILSDSPWIFESVTGFAEALDFEMSDLELQNQKLLFTVWETVDMRVSNMIHSILDAVFDANIRKVEILPRNLQEFSMGLLIHELRVFNNVNGTAQRALNQGTPENPSNIMNMNHFLLNFGKCRFKRSSGNSIMQEFSNVDIPEAKLNIEIEFKNLVRTHNFNTLANNADLENQIETNNREISEITNEPSQTFGQKLAQRLEDPKLANYRGLVASTVHKKVVPNMNRSQFNSLSYATADAAMSALKGQMGSARDVANTLIGNATNLVNGQNATGINIFDTTDVSGFIPKRLSTNAFFDTLDNYLELLKNPAVFDLINATTSNTKVNQRATVNIFNQ